ncbi:hypothetical protein [Paramagnetospirillum magneticum]|uniref:Uncharacterized protein n=1 Tax=Paramagnetospirillum magneticum (strain ATCC 700264 / AMB-1) TaxID=342108 RepID=Q2VZW8_PARM1|nr:hypothetical protein [Paramagnetospirillum magneticum]BAE52857.1 hypothetical protein amb4053 [Paramagnetospirillum magneticum AMB-1]
MNNPESLLVRIDGASTFLTRNTDGSASFIDNAGQVVAIPSTPELTKLLDTLPRGSGIVRTDHIDR